MHSDDTATVCYTLPPKYSRWLVVLSHYMLVNVVVAYRLRLRLFCGLAAGGYLTSVNYWRRPMQHDWRRVVDIFWINSCMAYHLLRARAIRKRHVCAYYYAAITATFLCYVRSGQWKRQGRDDKCAFWHMASHVIGGTANRFMYYALARQLHYS